MAKKIEKTCILCGKKYHIYCPTCREAVNQPVWLNTFHDENCKNIYYVCSNYNAKKIDITKARELLDKCDISNKDNFTSATQKIIEEIYKLTKPAEEEKIEEVIEETPLETRKTRRNKKR